MVGWLDGLMVGPPIRRVDGWRARGTCMNYISVEHITPYKTAFSLSNYVWNIVQKWDYFQKTTIGTQLVRIIDSISANIAEGFGKYTKNDKIHYYRIALGSVNESIDWIEKAKIRKLITESEYKTILNNLSLLPKQINGFIKLTREKLQI